MKVDDTIKAAILATARKLGSQANVARAIGITPPAISRYLSGNVAEINAATWQLIFPVIREFLPEGYSGQPSTQQNSAQGTSDFSPGDTVRLRSGGPLMTVDTVSGQGVRCVWFRNNELAEAVFHTKTLLAKTAGQ